MSWETVAGLEVHVRLATRTKIFCGCRNAFGDPPNTLVCPVCLGLPGALPVVNEGAVDFALRVALALGCEVPEISVFARKNYFYPDLPKGYQITQYDRPLAVGGNLPIEVGGARRSIALSRIHLEEDAGKSLHDETGGSGDTRIDLNRCGTPLIEIVSEPDLGRPEEAGAALESLRRIVVHLGVSDGDMSRGSMRCDANVSVRRSGDTSLGAKTEVKNLNSKKSVVRAIAAETSRQIKRIERGEDVIPATLLWDEARGAVRPVRAKEGAPDYRYFPEPDLRPLVVDPARRERVRRALPELPLARRDRLVVRYGIPETDAGVLTASRVLADWYEELAGRVGDGKLASNWTRGEVLRTLMERGCGLAELPVTPSALAELLRRVKEGRVSGTAAKRVFTRMVETGRPASEIVAAERLERISDDAELAALVDGVISAHPVEADRARTGEERVLGFLVGRVLKASRGRADPRRTHEILRERLGRGSDRGGDA